MTKTKINTLRVAIANATPFYRQGHRCWLPPAEWKSLRQWIDFLADPILLKPETVGAEPPADWLELTDNIEVQRLCFHDEPFHARRRSTRQMARLILKDCDVLYVRMPNYEGYWCWREARDLGVPMLLELHGDWESAILQEDRRGPIRSLTRWQRARKSRQSVREMARAAACALSVGPELRRKYIPDNVPSLVSTNHLLSEHFYRPRHECSLHRPPMIFFAGDIQRRKGLHILFQALKILHERQRDFLMTLAGTGPMVAELRDYARRHSFGEKVKFLGRVPHDEKLFTCYQRADVFVLPSVAAEGVPRVTHEAMAFGCPVIATDIGSIPWQLRDGAGLVVPPGAADKLAQAISTVLDNGQLRSEMSQKGFQRSREYTLEKQQTEIADFVTGQLEHMLCQEHQPERN